MLKIVLLWMLVLAIPAQGMAAATMLHCGTGHQPAQTSKNVAAEHAGHGHIGPVEHVDAVVFDAMTDDDADATQGISAQVSASDIHKASKHATHKCSACASCCAGIALISTPATLPALDPATAVVVVPKAWAASVVIDGPERPPRNFLA